MATLENVDGRSLIAPFPQGVKNALENAFGFAGADRRRADEQFGLDKQLFELKMQQAQQELAQAQSEQERQQILGGLVRQFQGVPPTDPQSVPRIPEQQVNGDSSVDGRADPVSFSRFSGGTQGLTKAEEQEAVRARQDKILADILAIDPKLGNSLIELRQSRNKAQAENVKKATEKAVRFAAFLDSVDPAQRQAEITKERFRRQANREDASDLERLSQMQPNELNLDIRKTLFAAPKIDELTNDILGIGKEPQEIFTDELDAEGNIIGQRSSKTDKVIPDPRTPVAPKEGTPPLSEGRFEQELAIASAKAASDINKAIEVHKVTQDLDAKTPAGKAKQTILEGKVAQIEINKNKQLMREQGKEAKAKLIEGKIDEAIALTDKWFTTGFLGQMLSAVGGTDARNLRSVIDTIQANLGFSELQAMRDASPTGGALGQVAVRELDLLQATIASLDQSVDDETLKKNLEQVRVHIQGWKSAVDEARTAKGTFDKAQKDLSELSDEDLLKKF